MRHLDVNNKAGWIYLPGRPEITVPQYFQLMDGKSIEGRALTFADGPFHFDFEGYEPVEGTRLKINRSGEIAVTEGEFMRLLAGEPVVHGLTRRVLTLEDGPFTIAERGGPGSGHHGHAGRPGEVGGSAPSGTPAQDIPGVGIGYVPNRETANEWRLKAQDAGSLRRSKKARNILGVLTSYFLDRPVWASREEIDSISHAMGMRLRDDQGNVLTLQIGESARLSDDWSNEVVLSWIDANNKGTGFGTAFMKAAHLYASTRGMNLRVIKVTNVPFYRRFPWLEQVSSGASPEFLWKAHKTVERGRVGEADGEDYAYPPHDPSGKEWPPSRHEESIIRVVRENQKCFISLPLENDPLISKVQIRALREMVGSSFEATEPDQYHITLLYIPEITDDQIDELIYGLDWPTAFRVQATALRTFDSGDSPLVLEVDPDPRLIRLQNNLVNAAKSMNLEISEYSEPAEFHPHITLALKLHPAGVPLPEVVPFQVEIGAVAVTRDDYEEVGRVLLPVHPTDQVIVGRSLVEVLRDVAAAVEAAPEPVVTVGQPEQSDAQETGTVEPETTPPQEQEPLTQDIPIPSADPLRPFSYTAHGKDVFGEDMQQHLSNWPALSPDSRMLRLMADQIFNLATQEGDQYDGVAVGAQGSLFGLAATERATWGDLNKRLFPGLELPEGIKARGKVTLVSGALTTGPGHAVGLVEEVVRRAADAKTALVVDASADSADFYRGMGFRALELPEGDFQFFYLDDAQVKDIVERLTPEPGEYVPPHTAPRLRVQFGDAFQFGEITNPTSEERPPLPEDLWDWETRARWDSLAWDSYAGGGTWVRGEPESPEFVQASQVLEEMDTGSDTILSVALSEAVADEFGGTAVPRERLASDLLNSGKFREEIEMAQNLGVSMDPDSVNEFVTSLAFGDLDFGESGKAVPDVAANFYSETQERLARAGFSPGDTVRLYRGLPMKTASILDGRDGGWVDLDMYALSRWTYSREVAAQEATPDGEGTLVAADFPVERIFSFFGSGPGRSERLEFYILGGAGGRGFFQTVSPKGRGA